MVMIEAVLAAYMVIFAFIHSYCATTSLKKRFEPRMNLRVYRFAYTVISVVTSIPIAAIWLYFRWSAPAVYIVPFPFRWLSFALMLAGGAIAAVSLLQTDPFEFIGLKAMLGFKGGESKGLIKSGIYSFVRHPLYLGGMLFFWGNPVMTTIDLTGSLMASAYFIVGSKFEEKKLIEEFGDEYKKYMGEVSGFLPIKWVKNRLSG